MRKRELTVSQIKYLTKLFPNDKELGKEVRNLINESNRKEYSNRKDRGGNKD